MPSSRPWTASSAKSPHEPQNDPQHAATPPRIPSGPTFDDFYRPFTDRSDRPTFEPLESSLLPEPYRGLLVHTRHMTVTVEERYGEPVDVEVLAARRAGDDYARKIVLRTRRSGKVVQFAIMRVDLTRISPSVRDEIVRERTPLGRILVNHGVLRTVRPTAYYRALPSPRLLECLEMPGPCPLYGRLGVLTVDGEPAIEVAEILAPVA